MVKYSIVVNYRVTPGSKREEAVLECAREYGCEADTHLFDKLLDDRYLLFANHKAELAKLAEEEKEHAERKRVLLGGVMRRVFEGG